MTVSNQEIDRVLSKTPIDATTERLCVTNSLSGPDWELDQVPASGRRDAHCSDL
jgi:hypothetical protein